MSFENNYKSRQGLREINKIADFIGKLIIKNQYEANANETSESSSNYYKYQYAYTKTDNFNDYTVEDRKLLNSYAKEYMTTRTKDMAPYSLEVVEHLFKKTAKWLNDNIHEAPVKRYLDGLRRGRIKTYKEYNLYYRQFMGIPNSENEIILVQNMDKKEPDDPDMIPIHILTQDKYPETYSWFIIQDKVAEIYAANPNLTYLKFIDSGFTPYYLRSLPNYSIIRYTRGDMTNQELHYFFKAYNKARNQIIADYIDGFDQKQPLYNVLMLQNLLYYTVINYSGSYIEKYSLCDYTKENLDDILDSSGYSNLKGVSSLDMKRRIVRNLPDLIENKANNYILEIILDKIIASGNTELKRYYIEKEYKTGDELEIKIDTSKSLESSVDLIFKEVPIAKKDGFSSTISTYHNYDEFVLDDNEWGEINKTDSDETKFAKKKILKRQILGLNFSSILSKYITLTKTIDILEAQRTVRDLIYLMFRYFDLNKTPLFFDKKISLGNVNATPAAIYAAMCWVQQMMFYGKDADNIMRDQCMICNSAVFRRFGRFAVDVNTFENTRIVNGRTVTQFDITPSISDWKVVDILKKIEGVTWISAKYPETLRVKEAIHWQKLPADNFLHPDDSTEMETVKDYVTVYRFFYNGQPLGDVTSTTTFDDLLSDYKDQVPRMVELLNERFRQSYDIREYQAFLFLQAQSRKDNSIYFLFKDHTKFSEYIRSLDCDEFVKYIQTKVAYIDWTVYDYKDRTPEQIAATKYRTETLTDLLKFLTSQFKAWVKANVSAEIYSQDLEDTSESYINDLRLLFEEFLSAFSELYTVNYKYKFGDEEKKGLDLKLFFNKVYEHHYEKFEQDILRLAYRQKSCIHDILDPDYLKLYDVIFIYFKDKFQDAINGDLDLSQSGTENLWYELIDEWLRQKLYDHLGLVYKVAKSSEQCHLTGELSLSDYITNVKISDEE